MSIRRQRLAECNPRWIDHGRLTRMPDGMICGVRFDCPEGHRGCSIAIPFSPSMCGEDVPGWQRNGALWIRFGDTFETLTLQPAIRSDPRGDPKACALHINITGGAIVFHGGSR